VKDFLIEWIIIPTLRQWAGQLASQDPNDVGADDRAARLLASGADELARGQAEKKQKQPQTT
jgi:hypothetical protein